MGIKETFREGEKVLQRYKNLIGIGVIFMLILFIIIFLMTSAKQSKIAEDCGFDDGKIRCVCTSDAWNSYQNDLQFEFAEKPNSLIITKDLNTS